MNHDELFKELLRNFFPEFFTLFLPAEAAQLDLSNIRFLEQEVFTDFPEGALRRADVVVEVRTLGSETEILLIHIEIQAKRGQEIPGRVWEYYHLLRQRHRCPVFPAVVYLTPGAGGITVERYREIVLGRIVETFEYAVIGLPDLPATDYDSQANPLAVSLSSLMRSTESNRVERKFHNLSRMAGSNLDESRKLLLATVIDRYLPLTPAEQTTLDTRIREQQGATEVMSIYTLIREDAKQEGVLAGERRALLRQLRTKFGELPQAVVERVNAISSTEVLEALFDRILTATTLDEMGLNSDGE
jgi:hypothetical protein